MSYSHFTLEEREKLHKLKMAGLSNNFLSQFMEKHRTSIGRELKRNEFDNSYIAGRAHTSSIARRKENKSCPKRRNKKLIANVEEKIKCYWSPEQISGRFKNNNPEDKSKQISYGTIYHHIYEQEGLPLKKYLRQGKRTHKKRRGRIEKRGSIPDRVFIDERPKEVDEKKRFGDWEGDTIEGAHKKGYIGTFVERKSKFLIGYPMPYKKSKIMVKKCTKAFSKIPMDLRKTLTLDNGKEFTLHKEMATGTNMSIYFAHPYHSWERGLNENTNGLLRQFFSKKMDLKFLHWKKLDKYVELLNNRPRKALNYRTPKEVLLCALQI